MPSTSPALKIVVNPREDSTGSYPVQLWHGSEPVATVRASLSRETLLEHEHRFSAHDYGMELYDSLFLGAVGRTYQSLLSAASGQGSVRVQLVIDATELHALPWERLFHVLGGDEVPLAASARTPFSRFLISEKRVSPPVVDRPLRLLAAIANPEKLPDRMPEIDVAREMTALADLVAGLRGRVAGTALCGRSGLPEDLHRRLEREGWQVVDGVTSWGSIRRHLPGKHVLHLLAHGQLHDQTAYLLLEHEGAERKSRGSVDRVPDQDIITGLAGLDPLPRLVFLAACESAKRPEDSANPFVGLAPRLVQAGVPAVVAMQDLVPVELAHVLTGDFYRRLFEHGQVDRALNEARNLLFQRDQFEWAIPVLFMRLHDGRLIELPQGDAWPIIETKQFEPETVLILGGPFRMGANDPAASPWEQPQHSVDLPAFRIGKYPVTNEQYLAFVRECRVSVAPEVGWQLADVGKEPPPNRLDHPVVGVTWDDAVAYCRWLTEKTGRQYRLPSEAEWEKAASWEVESKSTRVYPWGNEWMDGHCNVAGSDTTPVSAHEVGFSPYGVQDMLGNIWEWTSTRWGIERRRPQFLYPYDPDDGRESMTAEEPYREFRVLRGGSYREQAAQITCTTRSRAAADHRQSRRGFRVAMTT